MPSSLKVLILAIIAVFAPAGPVLATVMVLTLLDLAAGIAAAKKQGHPITSTGLKRTVVKVMVYEIATLAAFLVQQYLTPIELPIMKMVTGLIGMTELKSVLENLDIIAGGSFFSSLVSHLSQGDKDAQETPQKEPPKEAP